ncbi:MAG: ABC transporter permease [Dehalococcoidia bacterium]
MEATEILARRVERPLWLQWPHTLYRFARRKPLGALGGVIVVVMMVLGIITMTPLADLVIPYPYGKQDYDAILQKPSLSHPLGTDWVGRDELSRIMYGARVSILVGFGAVGLAQTLATILGMTSGYYGGRFDIFLQRFVDLWLSFPSLILILTFLVIIGVGLPQLIIAIGLRYAVSASRTTRSAVIAVRNNTYVEAARVVGANDLRIMGVYLLPNVFPVILTIATAEVGFVILTEATISFLGYGIPPPFPAWGAMLSLDAMQHLERAPWLSLAPGLAIALTVYGFNILGDALRDVLDPRLRGSF